MYDFHEISFEKKPLGKGCGNAFCSEKKIRYAAAMQLIARIVRNDIAGLDSISIPRISPRILSISEK